MSWIGKLFGGGFGFVIGGPVGAVLGGVLGHMLDMAVETVVVERQLDATEVAHTVFFTSTFAMLAKMAKADGVVTPGEIETIEAFMNALGFDRETRRLAIEVFKEAKGSDHSFEDFAGQFAGTFADGDEMDAVKQGLDGSSYGLTAYQLRVRMFELLHRVAMSDGVLHPAEAAYLDAAQRIFRIPDHKAQQIRDYYGGAVPTTDQHYYVLGARPSDSLETIKSRYRQLTREHHPDRLIAQGLPPQMIEVATRKLQEINGAYDAIVAARKPRA